MMMVLKSPLKVLKFSCCMSVIFLEVFGYFPAWYYPVRSFHLLPLYQVQD